MQVRALPGAEGRDCVFMSAVRPELAGEFELPEIFGELGAKEAIVLGSGLGRMAGEVDVLARVGYGEIGGLPVSRVPGHEGAFVLGYWQGRPLILASGRVHVYEGWSAREAAGIVRVLAAAGVETLVVTNAAGSLNEGFVPGEWMMIRDHLNLLGDSPLVGPRFVDMQDAYDAGLRERFSEAAGRAGVRLHEGVYAAVRGPHYETPAEVRMLRVLGADAVGMSTVPEVIQARALGLRVAGFSCLTNWAAGLAGQALSHEEVAERGREAAGQMLRVLREVRWG